MSVALVTPQIFKKQKFKDFEKRRYNIQVVFALAITNQAPLKICANSSNRIIIIIVQHASEIRSTDCRKLCQYVNSLILHYASTITAAASWLISITGTNKYHVARKRIRPEDITYKYAALLTHRVPHIACKTTKYAINADIKLYTILMLPYTLGRSYLIPLLSALP